MKIEDALLIIDDALPHKQLSNVQELLFRQAWEGKTYPEIAEKSGYDASYIRDVGYKLWQALSHSLGEKVSKNNLQVVLRRHALKLAKGDRQAQASHTQYPQPSVAMTHQPSSVVMPFLFAGVGGINFNGAIGISTPLGSPGVAHKPEITSGNHLRHLAATAKQNGSANLQPRPPKNADNPEVMFDRAELANVVNFKRATPIAPSDLAHRASHSKNQRIANVTNLREPRHTSIDRSGVMPNQRCDWGSAIDASICYGRTTVLATAKSWIMEDGCRLVGVLGMGGIGKTTFTIKLAEQIQPEFDLVIWRSLRHAPSLDDLLIDLLQFLQGREVIAVASTDKLIAQLIQQMRSHRCLIVLDQLEAIMRSGNTSGTYQGAYVDYGELLRQIGEVRHQSCAIVVSREKPLELTSPDLEAPKIKSLQLSGLATTTTEILPPQLNQISSQNVNRSNIQNNNAPQKLISYYGGNPFALKIVSRSILDLFDGDINEFLQQGPVVFSQVRHLLQQQCDRLSELEMQLMYWLALLRSPVTMITLQNHLMSNTSKAELLESLASLRWRSLIEKVASGFSPQPLVMVYVTEQIIANAAAAIISGDLDFLAQYLLQPAQVPDHVEADEHDRGTAQNQAITAPLFTQLLAHYGNPQQLGDRLRQLLAQRQQLRPGQANYQLNHYAAANLTYLHQLVHHHVKPDQKSNRAGLPTQVSAVSDPA
jgi:hypothetical protein